MTWTLETSQGFESDKIASLCVPYLQGKFLDLGCGMRTVWPTAIGVDSGGTFGPNSSGIKGDIADLSMFKDETMDGIFSSHALEDFPREQVPTVLREWARVLKVGGHLVLYVPSANLYPRIGQSGANPAHRWDIYPGDVENILKEMAAGGSKNQRIGWTLLESEERGGSNEYSLFIVVRKEKAGWTEKVWQRNPEGKKRCLVVRFGAIGDQIVAASVLPGLQKQGYHVTYMTTPQSAKVIENDPHVDAWWVQATDYVPNQQLGPYWASVAERFDKVVNFSESVEGALLALPGRLQHDYTEGSRRKIMGTVNYYERTHDIADVPHEFAPRFYPYPDEVKKAETAKKKISSDRPVVMWAIHGSSCHKVYPFTQVVMRWLVDHDIHVVISGDHQQGAELQKGLMHALVESGCDMTRIHPMAGKFEVRDALTFAQVADCVVGPETGLLNSVAMSANPKIIMLSHSSHENLTKHWKNTMVVLPDAERCPCYPCHRLHYGWEHCVQNAETKAAQCASSISPEGLFNAVMSALGFIKGGQSGLDFADRQQIDAGVDCTVD